MSKKIYIGSTEIAGGDGRSAYQSWLDQGNVGTEAQFLASLKGADGKDGKDGAQGNTGSSVDYPYELVNNVTTDDATKGLSAAQGVVLDEKISQLGLKINDMSTGKYYGFFTSAAVLPTATDAGYAYVGAEAPYTIYNWDGSSWTNSGVSVSGSTSTDEQVQDAVDTWLDEHRGELDGLSYAARTALMNLLLHVAYTDEQGRTYYDALHDALFPAKNLTSIAATFNQGSAVIYDNVSLDTLRPYLTVVATYDDTTTEVITDYTLAGELTTGTSTITVLYGGYSDTFDVTVTHATVQYSITNNLTECTNSNAATVINEQTAYSGTLTANSGYVMESVTITMGGNDITATAYNNGTINIASVTGNIVITAVATEDVGWVSGVPYDMSGYTDNYYISGGTEAPYSGWAISPYLPVKGAFIKSDTTFTRQYGARYDGNKTYLAIQELNSTWFPISVQGEYIRVSDTRSKVTGATIIPYKFPVIDESSVATTDTWYTYTPIVGKYCNESNGNEMSDPSYDCSSFLNCFGHGSIQLNQWGGKWGSIVFYDGNKNYISGVALSSSSSSWTTAVTIPEGARYVRISGEANIRLGLRYE